MKVLVVSDIHGNLPAIEAVLKRETDWDKLICLGDVVDYGPWSNECVDLINSIKHCITLMGNHEEFFIHKNYDNIGSLSYEFYKFCLPSFNRTELIKEYKNNIVIDDFILQHTINDQYIFADTKIQLTNNYFVGHSHRQFEYKDNGYTLVNPGSVGQNREFINRIDYALWYTDKREVQLKNIVYDISIVTTEMRKQNYPAACVAYYENKPKL